MKHGMNYDLYFKFEVKTVEGRQSSKSLKRLCNRAPPNLHKGLNKLSGGHHFTLKDLDRTIQGLEQVKLELQSEINLWNQTLRMEEVPWNPMVVGDQRQQVEFNKLNCCERMKDLHDCLNLLYATKSKAEAMSGILSLSTKV